MAAGVFSSMVFVFTAIGCIMVASTGYMESNIYSNLDENYLSPVSEEYFMQIAANVAEQVNEFEYDVSWTLT